MRPILILAMAFVLSPFSQPAGGQAVAKGPWEQLKEKKTAWFLLGAINDDGSLATVKTFVWVKQVPEESSRILPGKGDRIRLLRVTIYLPNHSKRGILRAWTRVDVLGTVNRLNEI